MTKISSDNWNKSPAETCNDSVTFIFGPKTRLTKTLLEHPKMVLEMSTVLISRIDQETIDLARDYPTCTVMRRDQLNGALPNVSAVTIICCAAGPIHGDDAGYDRDRPESFRDLEAMDNLIRFYCDSEINFVLVSSVVALAPRRCRFSYAGWKLYLEGSIREMLSKCSQSRLKVLYPGRMILKKSYSNPAHICYSTYSLIADRVLTAIPQVRSKQRIIGIDARVWLLVHRLLNLFTYFVGKY